MTTADKNLVSWIALLGYAVVCGLLVMQTIDSSSQRTTPSKRHIVPEWGMRVRISDLSMSGVIRARREL